MKTALAISNQIVKLQKKIRDLSILFIDEASMIPLDAIRAIDLLFQDIVSMQHEILQQQFLLAVNL